MCTIRMRCWVGLLALFSLGSLVVPAEAISLGNSELVSPDGLEDWITYIETDKAQDMNPNQFYRDSAGNLYVTGDITVGFAHYDLVIFKLSPSGELLWSNIYGDVPNLPTNAVSGKDIEVDSAGNVYIVGTAWAVNTGYSYSATILLRYSPEGMLDLERQYPTYITRSSESVQDMVLKDEYLYLTGQSFTFYRRVMKLELDGDIVWNVTSSGMAGLAIGVDGAGNVYTTGSNFTTNKFSPDGQLVWEATYVGPSHDRSDKANDLVVDSNGNVYITGEALHNIGGYDKNIATTIKYSPNGTQLWLSRYIGQFASGISIKSVDKSVIIGLKCYGYGYVQYDMQDGSILANGSYAVDGDLFDMDVDDQGNVYMSGTIGTAKIDPQGRTVWVRDPEKFFEGRFVIVTDSKLLVTGILHGLVAVMSYPLNLEPFVMMDDVVAIEGDYEYDYSVARFYIHMLPQSEHNVTLEYATDNGTAISGSDYVAVSGTIEINRIAPKTWINVPVIPDSSIENDETFFIKLKYSYDGSIVDFVAQATIQNDDFDLQQWVAPIGYMGYGPDAILPDAFGNIYLLRNSPTLDTGFLTKLDSLGTEMWERSINGTLNSADFDSAGNIYVAGFEKKVIMGTQFKDLVVNKYRPDGSLLWSRNYGVYGGADAANGMAVASDGSVYVTGYIKASNGFSDMLVVKYSSEGALLWQASYNGPGNKNDYGVRVKLDADGNAYVSGVADAPESTSLFLRKYSANGSFLWQFTYPPASGYYDEYGDHRNHYLAVTPDGISYLTDTAGDNGSLFAFNLDGSPRWQMESWMTSLGLFVDPERNLLRFAEANAVVESYDSNGIGRWSGSVPALMTEIILYRRDMAVDKLGNSYVVFDGQDITDHNKTFSTFMFDVEGRRLWGQHFISGGAMSSTEVAAVGVDDFGATFVAGEGKLIKYAPAPTPCLISISDVLITEDLPEVSEIPFEVKVDQPCGTDLRMTYETMDGSALEGRDFQRVSGTLTIPAGSQSATILIPLFGDGAGEAEELFFVNLYGLSTHLFFSKSNAVCRLMDFGTNFLFLPNLYMGRIIVQYP